MITLVARINAQQQITEWRGNDIKPYNETVRVQVRSDSVDLAWRLLQTNNAAGLRPVGDLDGEWTVDARQLEGATSGIEGFSKVPAPPLRVNVIKREDYTLFDITSAT
jgi:hypothetical protein